jgi:hypothetical protein
LDIDEVIEEDSDLEEIDINEKNISKDIMLISLLGNLYLLKTIHFIDFYLIRKLIKNEFNIH